MKTLQQVEPRIDIATVGDDSEVHHLIQAPGSYYLTADLLVSRANGIRISANDVTIDLNGFEVRRTSGTGGNGIAVALNAQNVRIRNGSVRGFDVGVRGQDSIGGGITFYAVSATLRDVAIVGCAGAAVLAGDVWHIENCRITNGGRAIDAGGRCLIRNCLIADNATGPTVLVGGYSSVFDTTITNNVGGPALNTASNVSIARCNISGNRSTGNLFTAIFHSGRGSITDCIVSNNLASGAATPSSGVGINANSETLISRCNVSGNKGDGIRTEGNCIVKDNVITSNGTPGDGAGINVSAAGGTRIEGNHIAGNDRGLDISSTGNVIRENTVQGNGDNYDIVAGNEVEILLTQIPETIDIPARVKLAGSLTGVANQAGITVASDNVAIDLNGHTLTGVANSLHGITSSSSDVTVQNGLLVSWGGGGIALGNRAKIENVTVRHVTGVGISAGNLAHIRGCLVYISGGDGISAGETSTIERCTVNNCAGNGIVLSHHSVARENVCDLQDEPGKAGILVTGSRNRVEANSCTRNTTQFQIGGASNLVIRNSASGPTGSYFVNTGSSNSVGPSVNSTSIGSNTNPHANYEH